MSNYTIEQLKELNKALKGTRLLKQHRLHNHTVANNRMASHNYTVAKAIYIIDEKIKLLQRIIDENLTTDYLANLEAELKFRLKFELKFEKPILEANAQLNLLNELKLITPESDFYLASKT